MINLRGLLVVALWTLALVAVASARTSPHYDHRSFCEVARSILHEARGNARLAEQIARKRGYGEYAIAAAKKFCSRD